jgi:hypothetical protein
MQPDDRAVLSARSKQTVHSVIVDTQQARCCDNPGHYDYVARCSCGWESMPDRERDGTAAQVQGHRLGVLEAVAGINFGVQWKR